MISKDVFVEILEKAGVTLGGSHPYDIQVHDDRLYEKLRFQPSLGAGEAYMEGWWTCERLDELFYRICRYQLDQEFSGVWADAIQNIVNSFFNLQTKMRSLKVAEQHYNLGNKLYEKMLGPSMAYTCGYWKNARTLDAAQFNKFDLICRKINAQKGQKILELGCGWGTFAKYAAEHYGCGVVAVNISSEQVKYAKEICKNLPIEICLCDYRDSDIYNPDHIKFDHVVSIGLCEHIGGKNYQQFLRIARENMNDEGLFLLHTIGKNFTSFVSDPWISKYIFPNSMLPSVKLLGGAMENIFILEDFHNFGADYDKTLMEWHKNFNANWEQVQGDYDERFFRLWNYYLLTCAGGFRARAMQLWQLVLSPKGVLGGYQTVR